MEDADIIALYWARDEKAIEASYQKYSRYCMSIARNIVQTDEDAEECLNDTWMGAWEAIPPARPTVLSVFLGKITRNIALNKVRAGKCLKRGGEKAMLPFDELSDTICDGRSVEEKAESSEITAVMNAFLAELPEEKRKIFVSRYWYGEEYGEIAGRYGYSRGKVAMMLERLKAKLRDRLMKEGILQ